jgi:NhaP-type Na+/H+ or K+/H+ antiporter
LRGAGGAEMSWPEIVFATVGGLRGAVSLILTQAVVTEQAPNPSLENQKVTAQVPRCSAFFTCLVHQCSSLAAGAASFVVALRMLALPASRGRAAGRGGGPIIPLRSRSPGCLPS